MIMLMSEAPIPDFLQAIASKAKAERLDNLECLWGNIEKLGGTKLSDTLADKVIVSNVFFQVEDKKSFIKEVYRILKPQGKVLFVDWSLDSPIAHKARLTPPSLIKQMFLELGFNFNYKIKVIYDELVSISQTLLKDLAFHQERLVIEKMGLNKLLTYNPTVHSTTKRSPFEMACVRLSTVTNCLSGH